MMQFLISASAIAMIATTVEVIHIRHTAKRLSARLMLNCIIEQDTVSHSKMDNVNSINDNNIRAKKSRWLILLTLRNINAGLSYRLKYELFIAILFGIVYSFIEILALALISLASSLYLNTSLPQVLNSAAAKPVVTTIKYLYFGADNKIAILAMWLSTLIISLSVKLTFYYRVGNVSADIGNLIGSKGARNIAESNPREVEKYSMSEISNTLLVCESKLISDFITPLLVSIISIMNIVLLIFAGSIIKPALLVPLGTIAIVMLAASNSLLKPVRKISEIQHNETASVIDSVGVIYQDLRENRQVAIYRPDISLFSKSDKLLRKTGATGYLMMNATRPIIEHLALIFIVAAIFISTIREDVNAMISSLIITSFLGLKILPLFQQILNAFVSMNTSVFSVMKLLEVAESNSIGNKDSASTKNRDLKYDNYMLSFSQSKNSKREDIVSSSIMACDLSYVINHKVLFSGISFNATSGDLVAIKGKSGSGKSTLIDILMLLEKPTQGAIIFDGQRFTSDTILPANSIVSSIAYGNCRSTLFPDLSIRDYFSYQDSICLDEEWLCFILNKLLLGTIIDDKISSLSTISVKDLASTLSTGQRQRLCLARILHRNAKIIILDEPTSALDPETEDLVFEFLTSEFQLSSIIIASHSKIINHHASHVVQL